MEESSTIRAIDKSSVHRICSGQVVLTLATAVKELVENSLDAGASYVEIRLVNHGIDLIEVSDNGCGVEEKNFEALTLKHYTSKLTAFSDLTKVDTFGFRGEALSSLCALSKLSMTTCHTNDTVGTKLEFDHGGQLVARSPCPRQYFDQVFDQMTKSRESICAVTLLPLRTPMAATIHRLHDAPYSGTTVCVEQLFSTLPVRHKEFIRNVKREFTKLIQVLSGYSLINTKVKMTCTNQVGNGKKSTVLTVNGNASVKENIADIYGMKQLQSLVEFKMSSPENEVLTEFGLEQIEETSLNLFRITGFISSAVHGEGRSSTDRQFYFINRRPFDPQRLSRLVNEVYHMFNRNQYPFVILDISIAKDLVDVNVTPDKRQIFLQHEKQLLVILKSSLMKMFQSTSSVCSTLSSPNLQQGANNFLRAQEKLVSVENSSRQGTVSSMLTTLKRSFSSAFDREKSTTQQGELDKKQKQMDDFVNSIKVDKMETDYEDVTVSSLNHSSSTDIGSMNKTKATDIGSVNQAGTSRDDSSNKNTTFIDSQLDSFFTEDDEKAMMESFEATNWTLIQSRNENNPSSRAPTATVDRTDGSTDAAERLTNNGTVLSRFIASDSKSNVEAGEVRSESLKGKEKKRKTKVVKTEVDEMEEVNKKIVSLKFSMSSLEQRFKNRQKTDEDKKTIAPRRFCAQISPSDNQAAESELSKVLRKDMFKGMKVLGQFNLGFIISQLDQDLFIVDQHASDEKFNFESLQRVTTLQNQRLIQPQNLELTAVNESILIDNLEIFKMNGFEFLVDEEAPATKKVQLVSVPTSKNWIFGKEDIEEMIFMLSVSPGILCRPSRIRQMLASRACRSSVMIGTALTSSEMKKLLLHMGEIDQPWNCPHGRPTIRHLINMNMLNG